MFEPAALREWIAGFGVFAPLVFVLVQIVQVVAAPIPGQVMALLGGYLFGAVLGAVYSLGGVVIGSVIAFSLSKRYGRPSVERLLHSDVVERFDDFVAEAGLPGQFVFVVIPGLPDDVVCFLAGLTKFRLGTFLGVMTLGRLPALVMTVYAGGSLANGQLMEAVVILGGIAVLSLLAYFKWEEIRDHLRRS